MNSTFIRVVEIWLPDAQHTLLEFGGGLYGKATRFGAKSRQMCFGRGEGLPGRAWDEGRPIVLNQFEGSGFRRTELAHEEGLTSGIALPVFSGQTLKAVLVIFCGDDAQHAGAIELWRNDPAASRDMTLDDGYYGRTEDAFEFISRRTSFRKGVGLPGMAWEAGLPVFLADLGKGGRFLRSDSAQKVGINRGFAFPCASRGPDSYVLAFLSALATPIVRRLEIWQPTTGGAQLQLAEGFCEMQGELKPGSVAGGIGPGQGLLGAVWADAVPRVSEQATAEPGPPGAAAQAAGLASLAALPVLHEGRVVAVVGWYF